MTERPPRRVEGALLSAASVAFATLATLGTAKVFTNTLSAAEVAGYALLLMWSDFLNLLTTSGLPVGLPKLIAAAPQQERAGWLRAALRLVTLSSITGSFLFCGLFLLADRFGYRSLSPTTPQQEPFLMAIVLLAVLGAVRDTALSALAGCDQYRWRALGIAFNAGSLFVLVAVGMLWFHAGFSALVLFTIVGNAFTVMLCLFGLPIHDAAQTQTRHVPLRNMLIFSFPLYLNSLLNYAVQRLDTLLLLGFTGDARSVALYEMAKRVPLLLSRGFGAILVPFFPATASAIASGANDRAALNLSAANVAVAVVGYLALFLVYVVQEPLLRILFSAEYIEAGVVLPWLILATLFIIQAGLMGQTLIALGKPSYVTAINFVCTLLSFAAIPLLLPPLGLAGMGVSVSMGAALSYAAQAFSVRRFLSCVAWKDILRVQIAFVLSGALLLILETYGPVAPWHILYIFPGLLYGTGLTRTPTAARLRKTFWKKESC